MAIAILPHHHHKGVLCCVIEFCYIDNNNQKNHEDVDHNNDSHHDETCLSESKYIVTKFDNKITKYKASSINDYNYGSIFLFPLYSLIIDILNLSINLFESTIQFTELSFPINSVFHKQSLTLRAPPQ